jgi:hypothetical protein
MGYTYIFLVFPTEKLQKHYGQMMMDRLETIEEMASVHW